MHWRNRFIISECASFQRTASRKSCSNTNTDAYTNTDTNAYSNPAACAKLQSKSLCSQYGRQHRLGHKHVH
jgi:hypothetical protein